MVDAVRPRVTAVLAAAIGSVPGCSLVAVRGAGSAAVTIGTTRHTLVVEGRSPSLHAIRMHWPFQLGIGDPVGAQADDALAQLDARIALQRMRAEAGLALPGDEASAFPLEISSMHPTDVEHLHVDASALAALLAGERYHASPAAYGRNPASGEIATLRNLVQQLHYASSEQGGGQTLRHEDVRVQETGTLRVLDFDATVLKPVEALHGGGSTGQTSTQARCQPTGLAAAMQAAKRAAQSARRSGVATMRGSCLMVPGTTLPDTIADSLAGRPLRDAIAIGPFFDARTIKSVRASRNGDLLIRIEPVRIQLRDVEGMLVRDALEEIAHRIGAAAAARLVRKEWSQQ